jgi:orotidine-5'-phosphate decarboxylase
LISFLDKLSFRRVEKRCSLCIGLDPALPWQRSKNIIPVEYLENRDENEARLNFCLNLVELTSPYCCAYKPNHQYVLGWTKDDHLRLTSAIRKAKAVSILDCKLGDIGDTVDSALYHIRRWGYDAITFNPFLGNLKETVEKAHGGKEQLGIIVLTLTSNREAVRYQKQATIDGNPLYLAIAEDVKDSGADGCVIGATDHVTLKNLLEVRSIVGPDKVFLVPGIGTQKGNVDKLSGAGENIIVNVSRDIIYSEDPRRRAEEYCQMLRNIREAT